MITRYQAGGYKYMVRQVIQIDEISEDGYGI